MVGVVALEEGAKRVDSVAAVVMRVDSVAAVVMRVASASVEVALMVTRAAQRWRRGDPGDVSDKKRAPLPARHRKRTKLAPGAALPGPQPPALVVLGKPGSPHPVAVLELRAGVEAWRVHSAAEEAEASDVKAADLEIVAAAAALIVSVVEAEVSVEGGGGGGFGGDRELREGGGGFRREGGGGGFGGAFGGDRGGGRGFGDRSASRDKPRSLAGGRSKRRRLF